jgi:hypothetical protein
MEWRKSRKLDRVSRPTKFGYDIVKGAELALMASVIPTFDSREVASTGWFLEPPASALRPLPAKRPLSS